MIPQNVTSRYVRNLLVKGKNNEFKLVSVRKEYTIIDGINVGDYYTADAREEGGFTKTAVGITPEHALVHCLEKHGVTFR